MNLTQEITSMVKGIKIALAASINRNIENMIQESNVLETTMTDDEYKVFKANLIRRIDRGMKGGTVL
ncbi:hypothetical protein LABALGNA3A7_09540 [Dellaglioa algida]|nr:hypothetical protein LABALGNA3A7_09540 [Dellaglioa algida]